jgi:tetrahydromethanopterin S-methyltransferase subunit G
MANEPTTKEDLTRMEENLARMIGKGFDGMDKQFAENEKQHQQIFIRLDRIEMKLENVVYRTEFEELKERLMVVEDALAINPKKK